MGESPVEAGDGGGHSEYQDERELLVSLHQQDEVSQGGSGAGLEVLEDDDQGVSVSGGVLVVVPFLQSRETRLRFLDPLFRIVTLGEVEDNLLDQRLDVEAGPQGGSESVELMLWLAPGGND